ncbi:MAG: rRNA pseudouridine synthase [Meiothermus sp.]|uniref:pseudouridine synthase n=1 Tax=Meiothermus sp. TaxID=1955249 RepID=UPI0025F8EA07|nr:pseudouridine synthase [Meiothermus sp.]MCS7057272.1 rRNA pseudouridine synthase [Meiothermus sp.]MCX7740402.1 rRNA pseudouridine synthase [Meiothermus sp.]MDW8481907.1 pseudouridine synthase [Meiothermus sp.]
MRLQQFLARAGVASRRKAEALIRAGRITVNDEVAELGRVVQPGDVVRLDGERVTPPHRTVVIALHKPRGYTTTHEDPHAEKRVYDLVPPHPGLHAVGRLDKETEGLLLLTNDGELTQLLTHPRNGVPKLYRAWCKNGRLSPEACRRLEQGVLLEDGPAKAIRAIPARGGVKLVLAEGRKREVRRMLRQVGYPVERLVRLAVGPIGLGRLEAGKWRYLSPAEIQLLRQSAHMRAELSVESVRERVPKRSGKGANQPRADRRAHPGAGPGDKAGL